MTHAAGNSDAPVIVCTAEILANRSLREGAEAAVDLSSVELFK